MGYTKRRYENNVIMIIEKNIYVKHENWMKYMIKKKCVRIIVNWTIMCRNSDDS